MSYNLTQEELNEVHDWSGKAEQLVRLGMMPVAKLPYIKRALKLIQTDAFLPLIIRKPFYEFIEELLELGLGEAGIYRLIRNKVAANRNDSVSNRYMPEETDMAEQEQLDELRKPTLKTYLTHSQKSSDEIWDRLEKESDPKKAQPDVKKFANRKHGQNLAREKLRKEEVELEEGKTYKDRGGKRTKEYGSKRLGGWVKAGKESKKLAAHKDRQGAKKEIANEETVGTVPQQPRWLKGKKLERPNPYEDKGSVRNKTETGDKARTLAHDVEIHENCTETDIKSGTVKKQPHWLKGGKLTRPNPYDDEESKHNKTKSKEIADKANSEVKVTEGRDNQYRYDMASGKQVKMTKKDSVQRKKDFQAALWKKKEDALTPKNEGFFQNMIDTMNAVHTPLGGKTPKIPSHAPRKIEIGSRPGGPKQPKDFKMASTERVRAIKDEFIPEEGRRVSDNPLIKKSQDLWNRTNPTNKISAIAKAQKDFDGRQTPAPKKDKPMPTGKAEQLKLNMDMVMNGEVLDEDVNYRKTPQGMLQTLAGMVKNKKSHGGKVSVNDRKIASKARNELRRRKYFGAGTTNGITSSFDPSYLDLADILAEENVVLTEEQLDELKKVLGSYVKKASADFAKRDEAESLRNWKRGKGLKYDRDDIDPNKARKLDNREKGVDTAMAKIKAHVKSAVKEEVEIDELHKDTYVKYIAHSLQDRDDHLLNYATHAMKGNQRGVDSSIKKVQKRTKGTSHAINRLHTPVTKTVHDTPKKVVKPSKTSWFKDIDDASDVSDVNSKKRVRKEDFEVRFNKTLELFEVKNISDLDEEMTKLFMSLVQSESVSDEDYKEKVYDKIRKSKESQADDGSLTPEQIRYRAEKKARADKAQSAIDAAKDELAKTPKGGWSKLPKDSA
jgi:hypothetical protein